MAPLIVVAALLLVLALAPWVGADSRPGVDAPPERWLGRQWR